MSTELRQTSLFLLGFTLLFGIVSLYYSMRVAPQHNYYKQLQVFAAAEPSIVFLGDSHAAFGLRNSILHPEIVQFAYPSENWWHMLLRTHHILNVKQNVQIIVIPLEMHTFAPYRLESVNVARGSQLADTKTLCAIFSCTLIDRLQALFVHILPLIDHNNRADTIGALRIDLLQLLGHDTRKKLQLSADGDFVRPHEKQWLDLSPKERLRAAQRRSEGHFDYDVPAPQLVDAFYDLIALAHAHDVHVIGIRYPVTNEYRQAATLYSLEQVEELFSAAQLDTILDYRDVFSEKQDLFSDEDHLDAEGAEVFSEIVKKDILNSF